MKVLLSTFSGFENPTGFAKIYFHLRGMSPKLWRSPDMGKANASSKICSHLLEIL
jgi:AraC-like DNA-binding protein